MKTYATGNESYDELKKMRDDFESQIWETRSPNERIRLARIVISVQQEILKALESNELHFNNDNELS